MKRKVRACIVVPVYNEEKVISPTICKIIIAGEKIGLGKMDLHIVNDASTDGTFQILEWWRKRGVRVLHNPENLGKARSIKRIVQKYGLEKEYDILFLLDSDTQPVKDYFLEVLEAFKRETSSDSGPIKRFLKKHLYRFKIFQKFFQEQCPIGAVSGQPMAQKGNWLSSYMAHAYWKLCCFHKPGQSKAGVIPVASGCCVSFRSEVFSKLSYSGDTVADDMDASLEVYAQGYTIVYAKNARVHTQEPKTLGQFLRRTIRWTDGWWQIALKHKCYEGNKKVDWEWIVLTFDGLVQCLSTLFLPLIIYLFTSWSLRVTAINLAFNLVTAICAAVANRRWKRWDIIYCFPLYIIPQFLESLMIGYSFIKIVLLRKSNVKWFVPERHISE